MLNTGKRLGVQSAIFLGALTGVNGAQAAAGILLEQQIGSTTYSKSNSASGSNFLEVGQQGADVGSAYGLVFLPSGGGNAYSLDLSNSVRVYGDSLGKVSSTSSINVGYEIWDSTDNRKLLFDQGVGMKIGFDFAAMGALRSVNGVNGSVSFSTSLQSGTSDYLSTYSSQYNRGPTGFETGNTSLEQSQTAIVNAIRRFNGHENDGWTLLSVGGTFGTLSAQLDVSKTLLGPVTPSGQASPYIAYGTIDIFLRETWMVSNPLIDASHSYSVHFNGNPETQRAITVYSAANDNVVLAGFGQSMAPVPEASEWAMMLAGIAVVLGLSRQKNNSGSIFNRC
jgi:hypothetical protein